VIVTNDSDLAEPVRIVAQELGLPVGLLNPHQFHSRELRQYATIIKRISPRATGFDVHVYFRVVLWKSKASRQAYIWATGKFVATRVIGWESAFRLLKRCN